MHSSEKLLRRLEKTTQHDQSWVDCVDMRSREVQRWINVLRHFANQKPGSSVADSCNQRADDLQERLNVVLAYREKL